MKTRALDRAYEYYQRLDRTPPAWAERLAPRLISDPARAQQLEDRLRALTLPMDPLAGLAPDPLELLIVAAPKDFALLGMVIKSALRTSAHPISQVTLIVPTYAVGDALVICEALQAPIPALVISEDDVITLDTRSALHEAFADRYGWVLQQLLCISHVSTHAGTGVLVLDADTLLLRPRTFLSGGRQVILSSLEHHDPYYAFLADLDPRLASSRGSHVTHHMLQQPDVWRAILQEVGDGTVDHLAMRVIERAKSGGPSGVSIDYELYAQGLRLLFPERPVPAKWCNAIVGRGDFTPDSLASLAHRYFSVSLHDYV